MEVINDLLNCSGLKIVQNTDWFNFSLDSVLLANFVKTTKKTSIIDFCTGNAPVLLFLSNKPVKNLVGIEIQKDVFALAKKSVKINNLENKITLINDDVKNVSQLFETDTFDLITCNPPYFKVLPSSSINKNDVKSIARHEILLELVDIFKASKKILKNNGKIAMIHRTDRLVDILLLMRQNNIEPKRIKFIYPFKNSESNLVLVEGAKNGNSGLKIESPIVVHELNGEYTLEVIKILSEN
ncbi:MAG: tRNA1(Val) (adenine(37)-N6)-methyltransferase [Bacilli bacterium]